MTDYSSERPIVVGLGELLWDCFGDSRRPGGAPANVAFQANQLGCRGVVCSRVGDDPLGRELIDFLDGQGLETRWVQRDVRHPTGTVTVDASRADHPEYTIHEGAAWDHLEFNGDLEDLMSRASAVCFGSLAQRSPASRETIHRALTAATGANGSRDSVDSGEDAAVEDATAADATFAERKATLGERKATLGEREATLGERKATLGRSDRGCLVVCDVNLRQHWFDRATIERSLAAANAVKLNEHEVVVLAELLAAESAEPIAFAHAVRQRYDVETVCVTRAERGCLMIAGDETVDSLGVPVEVADAVGAGDAFTAAWIFGQLQGWPLERQAKLANRVGAMVAASRGAMPPLADEFARLIHE
ncbi:MAG: hypothetical protein GX621_10900 [Pirellulaceae bacterium]|nr:hypothetical protein [Pirellulaceae bacterium]